MLRTAGLTQLNAKTAIQAVGLIAIFLSAYVIIHQIHHAVAATNDNQGSSSLLLNAKPVDASASSSSDTSGNSSNTSSTKLTINGQDVPVPQNGVVSQTVPGSDGSTQVDVNSQQTSTSGSGTASNHSSTTINVSSSSSDNSNQGGN